ncbi:MAG: dethiobiotin synthase [Vulcanimicrobiaceae bacterium]
MQRYLVTGTDTDVGKTRVSASLARAFADAGLAPTIVKAVQTGVSGSQEGDAALAGRLSGVPALELQRFAAAADPWSAAVREGRQPPTVRDLVEALPSGTLVVEGAGGLLVPLNEAQTFADLAAAGKLALIVVVALKLGCINHARLTLEVAVRRGLPVAGVVLCERYGPVAPEYIDDVTRSLQGNATILGNLPFASADAASVAAGARLFASLSTT